MACFPAGDPWPRLHASRTFSPLVVPCDLPASSLAEEGATAVVAQHTHLPMWNRCNRWRWSVLRSSITPGVAVHTRSPLQAACVASLSTGGSGDSGDSEQESPLPPPTPPPLAFLDVPYFEGEGACEDKHRLDVYIPSAPFPRPRSRTCLFVHGGSWQRGDRRHPAVPDQFYGNVGRAFAAKGMVGLVMSYRLAPGVQHPEQVRDVARAIRWARDNVSQYGGDGNDLVLVGHSAGAHLAALCLADARWLEEAGVTTAPCPTSPAGAGSTAADAAAADLSVVDSGSEAGAAVGAAANGASHGHDGAVPAAAVGGAVAATRQLPPSVPPAAPTPARVVSGFVGISGVYDIPRMAGNVLGGVLARTAFGTDRRTWHRASPVHRVRAAARNGVAVGGGGGRERDHGSSGRDRGAECTAKRSGGSVGRRSDGVGSREARTAATAEKEVAREMVAQAAAEAETGSHSVDIDTSSSSSSSSIGSGSSSCPLLGTEVLLLTAASDFHLEDDAEALMDALEEGKANSRGRTGGDKGSSSSSSGGVGRPKNVRSGGTVRHIRLEGEDHLSCMVSFGEPGGKASEAVLEFVLGLPPPRRAP